MVSTVSDALKANALWEPCLQQKGSDSCGFGDVSICQLGIKDHLCKLVPDGVAQVASGLRVCQMVIPGREHNSGEWEELVLADKCTVSCTLHTASKIASRKAMAV